jgi:predicted regulator of Ras-like GTPase activity (Roadblock/LC7/MglB family)
LHRLVHGRWRRCNTPETSTVLKSLFGDLMPTTPGSSQSNAMPEFAATAILETSNTEVTAQGRMVDRRQEDVYFSGSPGAAIREHLTRAPADPNVRLITMLDPSRMWAPGVVKALSDATGQPVERLHLRDEDTEQLRVTLERTSVPRRSEATLKIYHADVGTQDAHTLEAPLALMEQSHMAAVIVGAMPMADIGALMTTLMRAVRSPHWHCETLLFLLPPGQLGLSTRIAQSDWPQKLRVEVLDEPLTGTSSVWNALLGAWDRAHAPAPAPVPAPTPAPAPAPAPTAQNETALPSHAAAAAPAAALPVQVLPPSTLATAAVTPSKALHQATQHAALVQRHLRELLNLPGVLACGLADIDGGELVSGMNHPSSSAAQHDAAGIAAALAALAHANRAATQALDTSDSAQELIATTEHCVHLLRPCVHNAHLFLFARIKRHQGNLALIKLQLAETDRALIVAMAR